MGLLFQFRSLRAEMMAAWCGESLVTLPEMIVGIVIDRSAGVWRLDLDGEIRAVNESEWSPFQL
ncbi:hypothetical protein [Cryobacterium sp. SO1]|uniref:hypothetical protein n=1 Tax=Cryobacterium sp. SO1 TaxID=1897061 RepID=UPI00210F1D02|nr:hypothetical protein [Cryobacterium sp. SO1]